MTTDELEQILCRSLCAQVTAHLGDENHWHVDTPFSFPDGDAYPLYITKLATGGLRVSDAGLTLMHMSYDSDVLKLREGTRGRLLKQVLAESDMNEADGEFYMDVPATELGASVFRFGQALTRVHDLSFLNRARAESTFYEDLRQMLGSLIDDEQLHENYTVTGVPNASDYPVDYYISGGSIPVYLFGVPNRDKARLATIILQHLIAAGGDFDSMIVFQNMADLPRPDVSRLTNAANDQIDSLDAAEDMRRKLLRRIRRVK